MVIAALLAATTLKAAEHPKEHPTAKSAQEEHISGVEGKTAEHPKKGEHPAGHEHPMGSKEWTKQTTKEYTQEVERYVKEESAKGAFKVHDDKLGKDWQLKLVRIHKDRVVHLGNNQFFACSDFKSVKKGSKDKVDLDFYATKTKEGWKTDKVLIHKVNGRPRYTYNDKNEMVPVNN